MDTSDLRVAPEVVEAQLKYRPSSWNGGNGGRTEGW
jgi:hypothetical protein